MYRQDSIKRDRSFDSVLNKILRMRMENQESFKAAMYNFLIGAAIAAFAVVCFILRPFVRPLLWAFLIGAVLFPFKRKLASTLHEWFHGLERRDTNIFVAISLAPLQSTEYMGRLLVDWIREHWQILVIGIASLVGINMLWLYAPKSLFCWLWRTVLFGHSVFAMVMNLINIYILVALVVIYLTSVYFLWKPENSFYFVAAGQTFWIFLIGYLCSFLGAFQVPVFVAVVSYALLAMIYNLQKSSEEISFFNRFAKLLDSKEYSESIHAIYDHSNDDKEENSTYEVLGDKPTISENSSDIYFKMLFYACAVTLLYRNIWVFILTAIPITVHLFFVIGNVTGVWDMISNKISEIFNKLQTWIFDHHGAVLPLCLPGLLDLNYKIQVLIRSSLKSSVDLVTSVLMIFLMIFIATFVGVFFCVNIYSETIEVAYLGKDLVNKTITNRPELVDILPENIQGSLDDILDNAHSYGRRRIEQYIDDLLKDADPVHGKKLKNQILIVWDRLIQYWIDFNKSDTFGPRVPSDALRTTFDEIVDNPGYFKELVLVAKQGIIGWAKSNTNTILEVAESVWHIIRTNLSIIMSFTGEICSLVLSGGQAFVEFLLDMIVFFTALFYLLSSSDKKYAPLQIGDYLGISSGSKIADALENSISGVLIAMFKSAVFQGMFTWLVHTLFGARIVFLPSALAAILSAAPFLGSYWCALPAFLELWLAQDRFYMGLILFLLLFFVPPYVEQEIHMEIKGAGHPYLTGLAIAGGMYWMGWQGAIFGPLMLCFFIGIFEVASVTLKGDEMNRSISEEEGIKAKKSCSILIVRKTFLPTATDVGDGSLMPRLALEGPAIE